ncbi:16S rRNA (guanine(966)-N(2))-methyltransferase RsmD [Ostreibacterium oceani]|uniref:Ribosomal RNA small subunit methyltransferase D n=1 Tax=Ostreibacterium oceani TaxID=2654998 RepID=A0A6N7EVK1_9GAMM|nr:16S rRNA (guanine(966)-N(2))-methyltransferase RsmD [Ostreibacterium oceani]MPV85993.1 16S rRNA (guanine(966)-N(2))-methyltransferase RsmD [Ostreibacterium oceani]
MSNRRFSRRNSPARNTVKVMAGELRGRAIPFASADGLRPTGSRVRETLFNWLAPVIEGSRCLDLFAGSGVLGIEAISRGAAWVTLVESHRPTAQQLATVLSDLSIQNAQIIQADFQRFLASHPVDYDVVFLDPPYAKRYLSRVLLGLQDLQKNKPRYIFIEDNQPIESLMAALPDYQLMRAKQAGAIYYGLLVLNRDTL